MALDLFRVAKGLQIESEDFSSSASLLFGSGAPGGDTADQDAAAIGSLYLRTDTAGDNLQLYFKYTNINNSTADWRQTASRDYVDSVAAGLSWREPVLVHDDTTYADITAAETAANVGDTVDGITISAGDRILFSSLTSGNENVYIVSGSSGSWTFTEDVNTATDGDALLVQDGSYAETQWVFDGTNWVQFAAAGGSAELGFIRSFIGKDAAGAENPTYSSTNIVVQNGSLETAIGQLDAGFGDGEITNDGGNYSLSDDLSWGAAGTLTLSDALDELNAAIGDRTYTEGNFVTSGETVALSVDSIDVQLGNNTFTESNFVSSANDITENFDAIDVQLGNNTFTESNYVAAASDITENFDALDVQLFVVSEQQSIIAATNITTQTVVDSIPVASAEWVKWMITVEDVGNTANRRSGEVDAITDGSSVDYTDFARLKLGSSIAGLAYSVDLNGGNIRLLVESTGGVDVTVKRLGYGTFN